MTLQISSEKLPPAVNGKKYRDPQLGNIQGLVDLATPNSKQDASIKPLASWLRNICERGRRMIVRVSGQLKTLGRNAFQTQQD